MGVSGVRVVPGSGNAVRCAGSGGCSLGFFRGRCIGGALRAHTRVGANRASRIVCSGLVRLLNHFGVPARGIRLPRLLCRHDDCENGHLDGRRLPVSRARRLGLHNAGRLIVGRGHPMPGTVPPSGRADRGPCPSSPKGNSAFGGGSGYRSPAAVTTRGARAWSVTPVLGLLVWQSARWVSYIPRTPLVQTARAVTAPHLCGRCRLKRSPRRSVSRAEIPPNPCRPLRVPQMPHAGGLGVGITRREAWRLARHASPTGGPVAQAERTLDKREVGWFKLSPAHHP
jgi:hypothetical protein